MNEPSHPGDHALLLLPSRDVLHNGASDDDAIGDGRNLGRVGLSLRLVDATTGTTVWKARHEKSSSYMFYRPNLKDVASDLAREMIAYMPPQDQHRVSNGLARK